VICSKHFKHLPPCAAALGAAYKMGGSLARLYPAQATAIADVLLRQEPLDKKQEV